MKNLACELVGDIVLCIHNANAPSDSEWQVYVDCCLAAARLNQGDFSRVRQVVFTDGGAPNGAQREKAVAAVEPLKGAKEGKVAVMSASSIVRGIVTVFNWFNFAVRAFAPSRVEDAFRFLSINADESAKVWRAAERMGATLDGGLPKAIVRPPATAAAAKALVR